MLLGDATVVTHLLGHLIAFVLRSVVGKAHNKRGDVKLNPLLRSFALLSAKLSRFCENVSRGSRAKDDKSVGTIHSLVSF